jgi:hypothetical protein
MWTAGEELAALDRGSERISYRFHARDLHMILARPVRHQPTVKSCAVGSGLMPSLIRNVAFLIITEQSSQLSLRGTRTLKELVL